MGTKHPNANLQENYRKSKCVIYNLENFTVDFQRILCINICFHDPELYEHCPNNHTGDIAIFADRNYHETFENFDDEIEKYPEFQFNKSFDHEHLKSVEIVEKERVAKVEMNRFLKIIITMIKISWCEIRDKSNQVLSRSKDGNGLIKPPLAINMWGPKFSDNDVPDELDQGKIFPDGLYSTFQHEKDEECPAFRDNSKVIINEPSTKENNKRKYPCNIGGCEKDC